MLYRVEASLTAAHLMSQAPGLRHRVEEALIAILEAAEEIRLLNSYDPSAATVESPFRLHVGNWVVSYLLDLDRRTAKVVFVEMLSNEQVSSKGPAPGKPVSRAS